MLCGREMLRSSQGRQMTGDEAARRSAGSGALCEGPCWRCRRCLRRWGDKWRSRPPQVNRRVPTDSQFIVEDFAARSELRRKRSITDETQFPMELVTSSRQTYDQNGPEKMSRVASGSRFQIPKTSSPNASDGIELPLSTYR